MKIQLRVGTKEWFFYILSITLIIEFNPTYKLNTTIRYGIIIICLALVCVRCIELKRFPIYSYFLWTIVELLFCVSSSIWSLNSENTIQSCKNIFITLLICSMSIIMIENYEDFCSFWRSISIACLFDSIYVLAVVGFENIGVYRLGVDYAGLNLWNANEIGGFASFGCVMFFREMVNAKSKVLKFIDIVFFLFLLFISLNSGSRKALLVILFTIILYLLLKDRGNKKIRNVIIIILMFILFYYIIMYNDTLYEIIGARIQRMIASLLGYRVSENSMGMRTMMISQGIMFIKRKPLLGYGLDSYRYMSMFKTYAHNNFIEMAVDTGIIGFLIYYSIYCSSLVEGFKLIRNNRDDMISFLFSMFIILIINHMAIVAYYDTAYNIMFVLYYSYIKLKNSKNLNEYNVKDIHRNEGYI